MKIVVQNKILSLHIIVKLSSDSENVQRTHKKILEFGVLPGDCFMLTSEQKHLKLVNNKSNLSSELC